MKFNSKKWVEMPARGSDEWKYLMGELMKNINYAIANVLISNPDFEGFSQAGRKLLTYIKETHGKNVHFHRAIYDIHKYDVKSFGLGIFLKQLQPFMLPFLKIAKHKVGKEFRHYLVSACIKVRKRQDLTEKYYGISWHTFSGFQLIPSLPSTNTYHMRYHRVGLYHTVDIAMKKLASDTPSWPWTKWVAICKDSRGKAVLGINVTGNNTMSIYNGIQIMKNHYFVRIRSCKGLPDISLASVQNHDLEAVTPVAALEWERMTDSGRKTHMKG